jgi:glycosyltransferase involved in cell wall biosynthesis
VRILLVAHRFSPDGFGGVERYTQALAGELQRRGDQVAVLAGQQATSSALPMLMRERLPEGVPLYRIVGRPESPARFLADNERLLQLFTAVMVEFAPDVVHVNHLWGLAPDLVTTAHRYGTAVVVSLHDFHFLCPLVHLQKRSGEICGGPDGGRECAATCFRSEGAQAPLRWGLRTAYFRRLLGTAHRVIAYSKHVASYFEQHGLAAERVRIIPNGVSFAQNQSVAGPDESAGRPMKLAFCGAVVRHKGVHLIIEALDAARVGRAELLVVGATPEGRYVEEIRAQAATVPGLNVEFHGPYEPREMPELLKDTDYVIVPSLVPEAGPIVPREALALGIPTIVSSAGALPEAIRDGDNGLVFASGRAGVLAGILRRLSRDPSLSRRLRQGARATTSVTLATHAGQVSAVYAEAIGAAESSILSEGDSRELAVLLDSLKGLGFEGSPDVRDRMQRWVESRA